MNADLFEVALDEQDYGEPEYTVPLALAKQRKYYKIIDTASTKVGFFILIQE